MLLGAGIMIIPWKPNSHDTSYLFPDCKHGVQSMLCVIPNLNPDCLGN